MAASHRHGGVAFFGLLLLLSVIEGGWRVGGCSAWVVGGWKWEILSTTSKEKLFKNRGGNRGGTQERAWYGDVAESSHHRACRTSGQKSRVKGSPSPILLVILVLGSSSDRQN